MYSRGSRMVGHYTTKKLTKEILKNIDFDNVVYAEYASLGAMGNSGGVTMYARHGGQMIRYGTNIQEDEATYVAFDKAIARNKDKFLPYYGGMGNYVFMHKQSNIIEDDVQERFFIIDGQKEFLIDSSCRGVYLSVSARMK